ncbi:hypothetical protein B0J11DRAFT_512006 [Dendryphion nanum]|uniref:Uncharacterized protein n=1 Tax=Dendryphion nanum TaxID=256645 RepID=A0A9P9I8H5_9PLEO|nr:hypothetical protein B0J11DRAFT_512006 [Dendryphion nanum]
MTWSNTFEKINGRPNGVSPAVGPLVESCEYSIAKHSLGVGGVRLGLKLSEVTEVVRYIDRLSCFNSHTSTTPLLANDAYDHDFVSFGKPPHALIQRRQVFQPKQPPKPTYTSYTDVA